MPRLSYQKMIELLSVILRCPVCSNKYSAEQTSVIENKGPERLDDSAILVHADCERCKSAVVFSISLDGPEVFSVGMVTDLTSADVRKFKESENLTADEIIAFHSFLQTFDGDFVRALR